MNDSRNKIDEIQKQTNTNVREKVVNVNIISTNW